MVLPNFIVVGAAKSGTTSLWHYLMAHPEIFLPSIKETNYFSNDLMTRNNPIKSLEEYSSLFNGKENYKLRGEVSNSYLTFARDVSKRIKEQIPECLILIILRYPVDRLYSRYWHAVRDQYIKETFAKFSKSVKQTELVAEKIQIYVDTFGKNKVKVVFLEDFEKKSDFFSKTLFSFLDINEISIPNSHLNKSGATKWKLFNDYVLNGPSIVRLPAKILPTKYRANFREYIKRLNTQTKPKIDRYIDKDLTNFYREDIRKIEAIVGKLPDSWVDRL